MTFYLKYRPQALHEIAGQKHVKEVLGQQFLKGRLSHAYLFCGMKGTGKTSTARILAKMVNCSANHHEPNNQLTNTPCNKCDSCVSIANGSYLDLIEIDAASNRGIDDIRELRDKIKLAPTSGKKKVYIIDEAHMLTQEAFNALLKTLEEPPEHALFILATTEPGKIPETIHSRVQKLEFKQASTDDLVGVLEKIAKKEKIGIEPEALKLLAQRSEGSFRDALKLLEQVAALDEKVTVSIIEQGLLLGEFDGIIKLLETVQTKNPQKALGLLTAQIDKGVNIREYTLSILEVLRFVFLSKYNIVDRARETLGESKFTQITKLSGFEESDLIRCIGFFQEALEKTKTTSHPTFPLEIAVAQSCQRQKSEIRNQKSEITEKGLELPNQKMDEVKMVSGRILDNGVENQTVGTSDVVITPNRDMSRLLDKWTYILETVKPYNYSLEALLKQAKLLSCEGGSVVLEVPYSFHQRILESPKNRNLLESVLSDVLEKEVKVSCVLGVRPVRVEEVANVELAADDEVIRIAAEIFNSESVG